MPIKKVLEDFHFLSKDDLLPTFIPCTICVQHYVAFRIVLRGYVYQSIIAYMEVLAVTLCALSCSSLSTTVAQQCVSDFERNFDVNKWQEVVGDIWSKRLPHFRNVSGNGEYSSTTETYGFLKGCEQEKSLSDVLDGNAAAVQAKDGDNYGLVLVNPGADPRAESVNVCAAKKGPEELLSLAKTTKKGICVGMDF